MEIHKPKPNQANNKKFHKITQNRPAHTTNNQLATHTGTQISQVINGKDKIISGPTIYLQIKNTPKLIQELKQTPLRPTSAFASWDITNMYSNIPTEGKKHILHNALTHNGTEQHSITELMSWYEIVTQQNYFKSNDQIIIQIDGLAMGAPSSSIISEIFLQNIEQNHLPTMAKKHNLTNYFRYVDDILIVYDTQETDITSLLADLNSLHPKLLLTKKTNKTTN
jgi:hypothetical protein